VERVYPFTENDCPYRPGDRVLAALGPDFHHGALLEVMEDEGDTVICRDSDTNERFVAKRSWSAFVSPSEEVLSGMMTTVEPLSARAGLKAGADLAKEQRGFSVYCSRTGVTVDWVIASGPSDVLTVSDQPMEVIRQVSLALRSSVSGMKLDALFAVAVVRAVHSKRCSLMLLD
jgi:hypothetical protein